MYIRCAESIKWKQESWPTVTRLSLLFNSCSICNITLLEELFSLPPDNQTMHSCPGFMVLVIRVKFLDTKLHVTTPLERAVLTVPNHPVRSTVWNTNFANLFHGLNVNYLLCPWMCFWLGVYLHTCTTHSFRQSLTFSNIIMMANLFVLSIPSGVEPVVAANLQV